MKKLAWIAVVLLIAACSGSGDEQTAQTDQPAVDPHAGHDHGTTDAHTAALPDGPVEMATRDVACGCSIESVGSCGNYVKLDDQFVEITNWVDFDLGSMEWCGKEGVKAETSGEVKDGKFFAATLVARSE